MRAKQLVGTAALVALLSGSMALAAGAERVAQAPEGSRVSGVAPAVAKSDTIGIEANKETIRQRMFGIRERRDYPQAPPLTVAEPLQSDLCASSSFVRGIAGLLGFQDVMFGCQERD